MWNHICFCRSVAQFSSVQFSRSVVSDSSQPHESQQARLPCPSLSPWICSNSCPLSHWCHPAISSSNVPFSSCPQSLPASESFPKSQLFTWGGQSTGVSALASFLPKKSQVWSPSERTGWISLQSKGLSKHYFTSMWDECNWVVQSCLTLCHLVDSSTPSFPVLHHLPELAQTHAHWVGDAIQPSHPLSFPSPLPSNLPSIGVFSKESALCIR